MRWQTLNCVFLFESSYFRLFSTFLQKLSCEKNSIFALCAKTQSHFCPKTQGRGSFYLIKICEKTQKMGKKLRFSLKTQHRGSLRLLKSAPKPLKKAWLKFKFWTVSLNFWNLYVLYRSWRFLSFWEFPLSFLCTLLEFFGTWLIFLNVLNYVCIFRLGIKNAAKGH